MTDSNHANSEDNDIEHLALLLRNRSLDTSIDFLIQSIEQFKELSGFTAGTDEVLRHFTRMLISKEIDKTYLSEEYSDLILKYKSREDLAITQFRLACIYTALAIILRDNQNIIRAWSATATAKDHMGQCLGLLDPSIDKLISKGVSGGQKKSEPNKLIKEIAITALEKFSTQSEWKSSTEAVDTILDFVIQAINNQKIKFDTSTDKNDLIATLRNFIEDSRWLKSTYISSAHLAKSRKK